MPHGILLVTGGRTHQEGYAAGFAADRRARLIAVSDEPGVDERRAQLNQALADQLKIPYIRDLGEALQRPDVHIASVCTEHHRQGRVAIRCAEAGKHIYLDKPMAGSLDEARRLVAIVRSKGLRSQMFTQVFFPLAKRARRVLASGQLGELRAIHCDLWFAKGFASGDAFTGARKETASPDLFLVPDAKRELFNIAVYSLAMIRWLTARRPFHTVYAITSNYFFEENKRRNFEDFGALALTIEGGLIATISSGRTGWRSHPAGGHNRARLVGSRGSVFLDGSASRGEVSSDRLTHWRVPPRSPEDPMGFWASSDQRKSGGPGWFVSAPPAKSDQSAFLDCVELNREAEVTAADGLAVLEVLFAAYRSAAERQIVRLT